MQFIKLYNKITSSTKKSKKIKKNVFLNILDDFNYSFYEKILSKEEFLRFYNFFSEIDVDHPHLEELFSPVLDDLNRMHDLYVALNELNKCRPTDLDLFFEFCRYIKTKNRWFEVLKKIDSPSVNLLNMRFVSCNKKRNNLRQNKKVQSISLSTLLSRDFSEWQSVSSNFDFFHINGKHYEMYLSKAKSKASVYDRLGCQFLGDEVRKNAKTFENLYGVTNHGFRRITMTSAAAILAKTHSYEYAPFKSSNTELTNALSSSEMIASINVFKSKRFLEILNNIVNLYCSQVAANDGVIDHSLLKPLSYLESELYPTTLESELYPTTESCEYSPRSYPLHDFWPLASKKVKNIINLLESHPATGGRAIFDSYRVITPSFFLKFPGSHAQLSKKLTDFVLTISEIINPIILGEKNGKCYFVSYWH
jgi:hypothetical protein